MVELPLLEPLVSIRISDFAVFVVMFYFPSSDYSFSALVIFCFSKIDDNSK